MEHQLVYILKKIKNQFGDYDEAFDKLLVEVKNGDRNLDNILDGLESIIGVEIMKTDVKKLSALLNLKKLWHKRNKTRDRFALPLSSETNTEKFLGKVNRGELNFTELVSRSLWLSHYESQMKDPPLFNPCLAIGFGLNFDSKEIWDSDFVICKRIDASGKYFILDEQSAKAKLYKCFPITQYMSFKNYRVAGGSIVHSLRKRICKAFINSDEDYYGDLDIFIVTGESSEKETKANQIYVDILNEIDDILVKHFNGQYFTVYLRSIDCTTIFLVPNERLKQATIKIQVVHTIYEYESQMLAGFDLTPCQVLFDGCHFKATQSAIISLSTNMIFLDISKASENFAKRIMKYYAKQFYLLIPGLSRNQIRDLMFKIYANCDNIYKTTDLIKSNDLSFKFISKNNYKNFIYSGNRSQDDIFLQVEKDGAQVLRDYGTIPHISNLNDEVSIQETVAKQNTSFLLDNIPIVVYASNSKDIVNNPLKLLSRSTICKCLSNITVEETKFLFGDMAKAVWDAKFNNDKELHENLINIRYDELQKKAKKKFDELNKITWKIYKPGVSCSLYSVKVTAKQFYGKYYTGYVCNSDWKAKMQIIAAFRRKGTNKEEKECSLVNILGKDMIKLIFTHVDLLNYSAPIYL